MLSRERSCSWSSADRRCSNYIWMIDNFIAYQCAAYIRDLRYVRNIDLDDNLPRMSNKTRQSRNETRWALCAAPRTVSSSFGNLLMEKEQEVDHINYVDTLKRDPDSKIHGTNMGPIWGRQDPGGPHVGPMNFAIWGPTAEIITLMEDRDEWRAAIRDSRGGFGWRHHIASFLQRVWISLKWAFFAPL